jgi:hypothetical protein
MPLSYPLEMNDLDLMKPKFDLNGSTERLVGGMVKEVLRTDRRRNTQAEYFAAATVAR